MKLSQLMTRGAALTAIALFFAAPSSAQKGDKDGEEMAQKRVDALADLAPAYRLAEYGMEKKSPEALVLAGGMLLRVHNLTEGKIIPLDARVMDDKDQPVNAEKPKLFGTEAEELFDKAREMVAASKGNAAAIEALIKKAIADAESRGAIGGPKMICNVLGSPAFHQFTIAFAPGQPATVNFRATGKCKFEVFGQGGQQLYHHQGFNGSHSWRVAGAKGPLRAVTVKVINMKGGPVTYTITTN